MFAKSCDDVIKALEGPTFLLAQIALNITEVEALGQIYVHSDPCQITTDIDPETGLNRRKIVCDPIPDRLRYFVATSIYDLRHALDQIACAAVVMANNGSTKGVYFPFGHSENNYRGEVTARIPEPFQTTFHSFKAYPSVYGENIMGDRLCGLSKAAQGKHVIHCRASAAAGIVKGPGAVIGPPGGCAFVPPKNIPNTDEMVLGVYPSGVDLKYDVEIGIYPALSVEGTLDGEPAVGIVKELHEIVSKINSDVERFAFSSI